MVPDSVKVAALAAIAADCPVRSVFRPREVTQARFVAIITAFVDFDNKKAGDTGR